VIVLATGYRGQEALVRTGQPGLWLIAGSFAQCRIYSKYLALQIKASEEGLILPAISA
jgi:putative flavoprotein involved in K+ transport